jgi:hypothetical protein
MLIALTPVPKKFKRTSRRVGSASTGIPDNASKSIDERVALFSKLVRENPE